MSQDSLFKEGGHTINQEKHRYNALYRAKRKCDLLPLYGYFVRLEDTYYIDTPISVLIDPDTNYWENDLRRYVVVPETVGQYIGACDKTGAQIFEGDTIIVHGNPIEEVLVEYLPHELRWNISYYNMAEVEVTSRWQEEVKEQVNG